MIVDMPQPRAGRPLGPIAQEVLDTLRGRRPMTARELAEATQVSLSAVKYTCSRLLDRGHLEVAQREKISGVNKPVVRYTPAAPENFPTTIPQLPHAFFASR